uniref:Putative organic anion transporter n=1 Tax=Phlebotomus kandelakii TaxID=1109342 RepID=A0A6B2ECB5_9DIPT
MWRLVCNPVYVVTCLGACMELMIVSGFVVFLPKYLETQFSLGKSQASVFTGSIAVPGACIGIFIGGCLLKRFQLSPKGAVQFVLISNLICLACYGLLFFLGCENVKMAGTTIPYYSAGPEHRGPEPFTVNLTAACNFGCECPMTDVEPVCGNNGLTYFSPCHAGCTAFSSRSNYTNCACVHSNATSVYNGGGGSQAQASIASPDFAEVTVVPVATAGPCNSPCRTIYPFLILLFFMTFIVAATQMPLLMIVLRSVSNEERSFALGMQFVIFRLFGYIPAPIVFGSLIDSTCLLWKSTCGESGGRCLIYDIEKFRYKYVGLCTAIKIVALAIFFLDWWLVKRRKHLEMGKPLTTNELMTGSILSLDKFDDPAESEATKKVLIASRHIRNDSRSIQLEMLYDRAEEAGRPRKTHKRSSSCDVRITSRDEGLEKRKVRKSHSRNSSKDYDQEFRQKLTHFRNNFKEDAMLNIKNALSARGHRRNNSYDYKNVNRMLNCRKSSKEVNFSDVNLLRVMAGAAVVEGGKFVADEDLLPSYEVKYTHSRTNSKDYNEALKPEGTNLRHRRLSSKDLKSIVVPSGLMGEAAGHRRNSSQHKIQIDQEPEGKQLLKGSQSDDNFLKGKDLNNCV